MAAILESGGKKDKEGHILSHIFSEFKWQYMSRVVKTSVTAKGFKKRVNYLLGHTDSGSLTCKYLRAKSSWLRCICAISGLYRYNYLFTVVTRRLGKFLFYELRTA